MALCVQYVDVLLTWDSAIFKGRAALHNLPMDGDGKGRLDAPRAAQKARRMICLAGDT